MAAVIASVAPTVDPERVTPGFGGFLVFFALALVSWLLYRSFTTHMRRVDVRSRQVAAAASTDESAQPAQQPTREPSQEGRPVDDPTRAADAALSQEADPGRPPDAPRVDGAPGRPG